MNDNEFAEVDRRGPLGLPPTSDYEWDPAKSTATAWSTAPTRVNRGRRAYGRHGNAGNFTAAGIGRNKKRALKDRSAINENRSDRQQKLDEDSIYETEPTESVGECSCSSISSLSSFDLSRAETHGLDTEPTAHRPSHFWPRSCSASVNRGIRGQGRDLQ
mmetsp:Transcript_30932/g.46118  ORF Transcript_30932/g.46118 Transcript_30932/m.46118 type:complete len:160 (-) Transcript_30932:118-597(-)